MLHEGRIDMSTHARWILPFLALLALPGAARAQTRPQPARPQPARPAPDSTARPTAGDSAALSPDSLAGRIADCESSVVIIVTSAHRRIAFEACHYAIDRLKKIVPIWKKEFFEDGEVWVEGEIPEERN